MQFSILTLAAFTLLPQALALPGGENFAIPTVAPNQLPPDMTPRGDFNEADGRLSVFQLSYFCPPRVNHPKGYPKSPWNPSLAVQHTRASPEMSYGHPLTDPEIVFAITAPAGCSIISCAQVLSEAVCIANALDDDNWKKIFKCAKVKQVWAILFLPLLLGRGLMSSMTLYCSVAQFLVGATHGPASGATMLFHCLLRVVSNPRVGTLSDEHGISSYVIVPRASSRWGRS